MHDDGWFLADEDSGKLSVSSVSSLLVAVEPDVWCANPSALWTGEGLGWGWFKGCLALSTSRIFVLRHGASLPRAHDWPFSLTTSSCLGLWTPDAMTDGRFPTVHAVSSAGLWIFVRWRPSVFLFLCQFGWPSSYLVTTAALERCTSCYVFLASYSVK